MITEKALAFNSALGGSSTFKASHGWLAKFCARHGIREISLQGEILSCDQDAVDPFKDKLKGEIEKLLSDVSDKYEHIYNCDETGLFWCCLPSHTLADGNETHASGFKKAKERVTLLLCANASGSHKLPLLMIGKYKKP